MFRSFSSVWPVRRYLQPQDVLLIQPCDINVKVTKVRLLLQEPADLSKQFPDLAEDFHTPHFFDPDQFFSSVFRISSCGLQLWTHYDVSGGGAARWHTGLKK